MKFYIQSINQRINQSTYISCDKITCCFYHNNQLHNIKNTSVISCFNSRYKWFYLDGTCYGTEKQFNKQSWRKFCKLKAFL